MLHPWTENYKDLKTFLKVYVDRLLADQMIQRQRGRPTHRALPITTRSQPAEETLPWMGIVKPKFREARPREKARVDEVEAVEERGTTEESWTRVKE